MNDDDREIRWQVSDDFVISWEEWGDDALAFHSGSGQTHLLNEIAVCVLRFLQAGSYGFSALINSLDDRIEGGVDQAIRQQVRDLLDRFELLGLIEVARE